MLPRTVFRKTVIITLCVVLTVILGIVDFVTGRDVVISPFYLVPICWAAWWAGRKAGMFLAVVSAVVWFIADWFTHYAYPHFAIPYWNTFMLLALFVIVVWLLSAFQSAQYHLEETVQRRTAALQKEIAERKRLEIAKLQAERLAVVGTMAAEVAHEVRNPLGSITLNLDLVQKELGRLAAGEGHSPQEGLVLVDDMRAEVQRIQRVIEEYLQFARLPKPQRRPTVLNELLEQKLAFMNGEFERANTRLRTHFDPTLPSLNADGEQLWQAVLNLIRNGLEAMPNGGELTIGTWRQGNEAQVRVTDNGKGMSAEQLRQVFVPFFTTKKGGTGLGLALVQQIVTEHGGYIECDSVPDKGSTFTIVLPLEEKA